MKKTATDVLRDHARERWLRRAVRSANLDGDLASGAPRMSASAWLESCALVVGVPDTLLDILGARECLPGGVWQNREGIDLPDRTIEVDTEQVATPLTLAQAASKVGLSYSGAELKAARLAAIQRVTENMLRRRGRDESLTAAREGTSP